MVIFNKENNHNGLAQGAFYIQGMDLKLLLGLYDESFLKGNIAPDFLEYLQETVAKIKQEKVESVVRTYYGLDVTLGNKELELNKMKSVVSFFIGVFFLFLLSSLSPFGYLIKEVLSIAGWVAIWETVNVILLETIRIKMYKINVTRLYNSTIEFITKE